MIERRRIVPGARLRFVHGLHPGSEIVVRRVTATSVQFTYAHHAVNRGKDDRRRYSAALGGVIVHMEEV